MNAKHAFAVSSAIPRHIEAAIGAAIKASVVAAPQDTQRKKTERDILVVIRAGGKRLTRRMIADGLDISTDAATKRIQRLEAKGFAISSLANEPGVNNCLKYVSLTRAGIEAIDE